MSIYRFRQIEITFYIVGIILTFMTYVLVFHWYGDHFSSRYLLTGRLICYLSHSCKYSWPAQIIFSLISIFLTMYCTLRFSAIYCDRWEQKFTCFSSIPPRAVMSNGVNEPWSTSRIRASSFLFTLIYFVCFSEFLISIPPNHWVEYPTLYQIMPAGPKSRTL